MIVIDARAMEAPEPFERVIEALRALPHHERLLLRLWIEPVPLYRFLERNGYRRETTHAADGSVEVTIWEP